MQEDGKDFHGRQEGREEGISQAACHVVPVAVEISRGGEKAEEGGWMVSRGREDGGGYTRPSHPITWPVITQHVNDINFRLGTLCLSHKPS